ncbi:hypothetical protein [Naasia sp. SYSU D00948]|uniref:hypothetical protein n=1 Tax=Naasia sp. SYSU D00948 TaxID=2817379 RepID=UPI001B31040C|nr:hypothetical protein [Naasia sp. SYSU D00948]
MTTGTADTRTVPARRVRIAQVLAWTLAVAAAVPFFGLIDLATLPGWVNQEYIWEVPLEVSWGSLFTFFVALPYVWIALAPGRALPGLALLAIAAVALALSAAAGLDPRPAVPAAVIGASVLGLGWLLGTRPTRGVPVSVSRPLAILAVAGAGLWLPYVLAAFEQSRAGVLGSITNGIEHWPVQGAAGAAVALATGLAAVWPPARRLFRVAISLSAALIGLSVAAYPERAGGTEGITWCTLAVLWGLAVALIPSREAPGTQERRDAERRTGDEARAGSAAA